MKRRLDTVITAETPEAMELSMRCAGVVPRACAFVIDTAIRGTVFYLLLLTVARVGGVGVAMALIGLFLLNWIYGVVFELSPWAATPGKRALGLLVVMDNGLPITPEASLVRNLLRVVDFLPLSYGLGVLCVMFRRDFKRIGDLAAGTLVVYAPVPALSALIPEADPSPPRIALTPAAQSAVIAFAMRVPRLTSERAQELAQFARPAFEGGAKEDDASPQANDAARLISIAHWLLGHRTRGGDRARGTA